jgi:hypothetical protein
MGRITKKDILPIYKSSLLLDMFRTNDKRLPLSWIFISPYQPIDLRNVIGNLYFRAQGRISGIIRTTAPNISITQSFICVFQDYPMIIDTSIQPVL